jgi:cyclopropane-fatty-acyl-phospholipid synthase
MIARIFADKLFRQLDNIESGALNITTPDGKTRTFGGKEDGEDADMVLHDWKVIPNFMLKGDIGLAEDYRTGKWESDDLVSLATLALKNRDAFEDLTKGNPFFSCLSALSYLFDRNTLRGSKRNIQAHYDLGNAFYKLWLDPTMTYSAAIFRSEEETLENAQYNKYDRLLDCLPSRSGNILEVGCGWGGFAERAIHKGDYSVKGITLSSEQREYAQRRLNGSATIALEDYRHQKGKFDHIVSIEMFEAVGEKFWPVYFRQIGNLLKKNGKAVIQTITINDKDFSHYRKSGDFIRSFIFPGGMLPSPSRFNEEAAKAEMKAENPFYFGQDYAKTLRLWLKNFDSNIDNVKALGYDDGFIRLWRFYLAGCIAGFRTGRIDVMQTELSHA